LEIRGTVTDLPSDELQRVQARLHIVEDLAGYSDVPPTVKVSKTLSGSTQSVGRSADAGVTGAVGGDGA
jgi:hypothetical protein